MPGAPSSVLAPSSKARSALVASLLLVAMPGAPSSVLAPSKRCQEPLEAVLAPSSDARSRDARSP